MSGILGIDPGPTESAWLLLDVETPIAFGIDANEQLLEYLREAGRACWYGPNRERGVDCDRVVIEKVASYGMAVGAAVFETVFWSGRFAEAADPLPVDRITNLAVRLYLCHNSRASGANIRQALLDRYGPGRDLALGTKRKPGPLYGVSKDVWSALAVAVTAADGAK